MKSTELAWSLGRTHGQILAAITKFQKELGDEKAEKYFKPAFGRSKNGRLLAVYEITDAGLIRLSMVFKGPRVRQFKESIVSKFEEQELG